MDDGRLRKTLMGPARMNSAVLRYGLAILSFAFALGLALFAWRFNFRDVEVPLLLVALAITAWYAGPGPTLLILTFSIVFFDYFFTEPYYTLYIELSDLPRMLLFTGFAALVAWFSAVRRRVERELAQARDRLEIEVAERTHQASLLDLTHDSIFVRDMNFVVTYWNRGAEELYGWTAAQAIGKLSNDLLETAFPAPIAQILAELETSGRWEGELKRTRSDGAHVIVASRWSLKRDDRQQPIAIMETSNDITERKHREEQIKNLNHELARRSQELEGTNKELEAFAYSVSHDLRAPLRHMAGYTDLLQKKVGPVADPKSRHYMNMILDSTKRMGRLIDDLLAFSRIGRAETQKSTFSLDQLAREALSEIREETSGREIDWRIGPLPSFYGDRSMLRLVLVNLFSNAAKFTRTRPKAEIEVGFRDEDGGEMVVFVKDNGVGFDMRYVNKLFGVFQRLHRPDTFEGTGIGLATVQRIVHRHGGRVWAEGLVDGGAIFYFSAPKP
jgi:PAS domain S-box-containing protein